MSEQFKPQKNGYEEKELNIYMKSVLRDYCNNFSGLILWYHRGGLSAVKELIKDIKLPLFEEYYTQKNDPMLSLTDEEINSVVFKNHVAILDAFATEINTYRQDITEEIFKKGMDEVNMFLSKTQ